MSDKTDAVAQARERVFHAFEIHSPLSPSKALDAYAEAILKKAIALAKGRIPYQVAKANGYAHCFDEAFSEVLAALEAP